MSAQGEMTEVISVSVSCLGDSTEGREPQLRVWRSNPVAQCNFGAKNEHTLHGPSLVSSEQVHGSVRLCSAKFWCLYLVKAHPY